MRKFLLWLKRLFKKRYIGCKCAKCQYKLSSRRTWFCRAKIVRKGRHETYESICGNKRPKTTPKWCPLKK